MFYQNVCSPASTCSGFVWRVDERTFQVYVEGSDMARKLSSVIGVRRTEMLRKLVLLLGGIVLAFTLALPAAASPTKKPSPAQQACLDALKQQNTTFHDQQQAAHKAFHAQQKAQNTAFREQQKTARQAFNAQQKAARETLKAANPTEAQTNALHEQQKTARKAFKAQEKAAAKAFHAQQKAAAKAFHAQQKAAREAAHAQQKAAKAACKAL